MLSQGLGYLIGIVNGGLSPVHDSDRALSVRGIGSSSVEIVQTCEIRPLGLLEVAAGRASLVEWCVCCFRRTPGLSKVITNLCFSHA